MTRNSAPAETIGSRRNSFVAMWSPLPLDFGDLCHQIANFIAIKFGHRRNAVDVSDQVFRCTQKCFERCVAIAATENVAVRGNDHFDQSGRGPVFSEQASKDRLKVLADLYGTELMGAILPNLFGFTDGGVFGHCRMLLHFSSEDKLGLKRASELTLQQVFSNIEFAFVSL